MPPEWLEDERKVPDDVHVLQAVYAVRVLGQSPEKVAEAYITLTVRAFTAG